jgi:hypothetical protein
MIDKKPDDAKQRPEQSFEVRYSEKFLREKGRKDQATRLFGAALMLLTSIFTCKDSLEAYRAHSWVNVAGRINQQILVPPIIGALLGLLLLCIGLFFIWDYLRRRH